RLVDDDQVPRNLGELLSKRTTPGRRHRCDDDRRIPRSRRLVPRRAALSESWKPELAVQVLPPLLDQAGRHEDQRPVNQPAEVQLAQHQAGLDGLAQARLVCQDGPSTHPAQRRLSRTKLIAKRCEPEAWQRDEGVEAGFAPHPYPRRPPDAAPAPELGAAA